MTEPFTFSSAPVDSNRAKAGVAGLRRNADRLAAELALGSYDVLQVSKAGEYAQGAWRTYSSGKT